MVACILGLGSLFDSKWQDSNLFGAPKFETSRCVNIEIYKSDVIFLQPKGCPQEGKNPYRAVFLALIGQRGWAVGPPRMVFRTLDQNPF